LASDPSGERRYFWPKLLRSNFRFYLAGLIEGDGTIIVPKPERSAKGRLNYPSIQIIFNSNQR